MTTHTVDVTDEQAEFIRQIIATGEFHDINEVVQAGLRLLEHVKSEQEAKSVQLAAELRKGFEDFENGRTTLLRTDEEIETFRAEMRQRCMERLAKESDGSAGSTE